MKLAAVDVIVTAPPPPGWGGRYWILVKVTTACGVVGWGECYASSVGPDAMRAVIADVFARHMEGTSPFEIELMFRRAYSSGFTQRPDLTVMGAFSGLEIACWDIIGKALDQPVHKLIGGRLNQRLRAYTYLYPDPEQDADAFWVRPEMSAEAALVRVERDGFTALKFDPAGPYTIRAGHMPSARDLSRSIAFCKQIREAVGDRADLLFGTHGQFSTPGALRMAQAIAPYDPLWFEEPVPPDSVASMEKVIAGSAVPVATGERLTTKAEFAPLLRAGLGILQPALGRVGGINEARKIAAMAEVYNAQMAPHLYAGPIEWAANVQLGAAIPNLLLVETIGTGGDYHRALIGDTIAFDDGHLIPPTGPGLGINVDEELARAHPYTGSGLHLEMQEAPCNYREENVFGGGAPRTK